MLDSVNDKLSITNNLFSFTFILHVNGRKNTGS